MNGKEDVEEDEIGKGQEVEEKMVARGWRSGRMRRERPQARWVMEEMTEKKMRIWMRGKSLTTARKNKEIES